MIPSGLRIDADAAVPVILVFVAGDPKSEFHRDQFARHIAGAKSGSPPICAGQKNT
jgi:hypothetical protein